MERVLILKRIDLTLEGNIRTEGKKEGGDWRMDGEKVYGEGGSGKGEIIWNVNK